MAKRSVLGRGLGALIDDAEKMKDAVPSINEVELRKIEVNPFQPRSNFDQELLNELAVSIKEIGLIQPLTLRKIGDDKYQIIAGERRFRAAQIAGLKRIPAYIRHAEDEGMLEMALVENIQREDLDAIEIAFSYNRLIEECKLTQEGLSERIGKKRSTIANYLRLLKLPAIIQKGIRDKEISMGHARALVNIGGHDTQVSIYEQILKNDLSVRKVEELVRNLGDEIDDSVKTKGLKYPKAYQTVKDDLSEVLNSNVDLSMNNRGRGKIVISFKSARDLERIVELIKRQD
ncbi:MAG: ParB/RepB/Spo0J family partition protein [Mariniphaga sp.]|nr:ParB/RepB/Spo0J family partition protein [Mariniphaga sp.]